ncbi:MAG: ClbS/DfsB family four-helix bundle protein [Actinomycetota bacterium]
MTKSKKDLLDEEDAAWHPLRERFHQLSDDDYLKPGVNGDWNAKDMLAHIAVWHASATDRLESHRTTGTLPPLGAAVDAINAEQYERCKDLNLNDAKAMSGAARHRFREEMAMLPNEPDERVAMLIYGDGAEHYQEHIEQLDEFLGAR